VRELEENDIRKCEFLDWAEDMLILHGTQDEIVPFDQVNAFCEEQLIEFVPIQGADHRFRSQRAMDQAIKCILDFFDL
jgi:dipeptidyl aminopeptidase/acylaminoacyl peptidase